MSASVAELSAEFAGTTLLMLFGLGVEAQTATADPAGSMGGHDAITWAWGLGVTIACYVAARLSGAHLNPAVTVALAACNGFPWRKVAGYIGAQLAGATVAAVAVRILYQDLIVRVDPALSSATQTVFSTLPGPGVTLHTALFDQVLGTAILVFVVCALTAGGNNPPLANLEPVVVGLLVVAIGMSWGANAGYAINPARDLPPRLVSWLTGYRTAWVDAAGDQYWWVPVVGPLVGGVVGAFLFKFAVAQFLPAAEALAAPAAPAAAAGAVPPADDTEPGMIRARLAERLAAAREEAAAAVRRARQAAEQAHALETGYARLAAEADPRGWPADWPAPGDPERLPPVHRHATTGGWPASARPGPAPVPTGAVPTEPGPPGPGWVTAPRGAGVTSGPMARVDGHGPATDWTGVPTAREW